METQNSVAAEYAPPIPVMYMDPKPVCQCPDLGEENLVKITETAYKILRGQTKLTQELEDQIKNDRSKKRGSQKTSTLEGGESMPAENEMMYLDNSGIHNSKKSRKSDRTPHIMQPPFSDNDDEPLPTEQSPVKAESSIPMKSN